MIEVLFWCVMGALIVGGLAAAGAAALWIYVLVKGDQS